MAVVLLHQGGVGPEHQLDLTGASVVHRVPSPVLRCVVHVEAAVIAGLGAFDAGTCFLGNVVKTFRQMEKNKDFPSFMFSLRSQQHQEWLTANVQQNSGFFKSLF